MEHRPVLVGAAVDLLAPALEDGGVFVDATLGRAGHAGAVLRRASRASLVGIDRDPEALEESGRALAPFGDRVTLVRGRFAELAALLERLGAAPVRGVLFDLGVSSPQLDDPGRGFSFRGDGPLDMRMDPAQPATAEDVVNRYSENDLARLIGRLGEERFARRIAKAIVRARPIRRTSALAEVVVDAIPAATRRIGGHPARRTFQALRLEVNREIDELAAALPQAIEALEPGGRVVAISYHSLEDRLIKRRFIEESRDCTCPPDFPVCTCGAEARIRILVKRPVRPPEQEQASNPRSASAKLRAAERLATPAAGGVR
ncbi:MAG: 16S rRNA (cytosine(1402)-N(4))-methyltransferase RsmH [Actinomycetota bacterium]|nr:16S rRNA (cytosine(1402)-N(4))-methyltransferase RsmH [Actinomycetota bacterium]